MERTIKGTLILSALLLGSQVNANELNSVYENNWSVGIGSYAFTVANSDDSNDDLNFEGLNLSAGYAFNNHFQIRGTYFSLEHDEISALESKGYDIMAYSGVGFSRKGFKGYGGIGYFSDKWSESVEIDTFSGFQLGGGLGYNWGPVALDFVLNLRKADKYEDLIVESGTYVAMSGNLAVSYLF